MAQLSFVRPDRLRLGPPAGPASSLGLGLGLDDNVLDGDWVRDRLIEDPSLLGLGELSTEQAHWRGGRLELLLHDTGAARRYAAVIQLGAADEAQVLRTLELWAAEREREPDEEHHAVLVAEDFPARLLGAMNLLGDTIPLAAVEMAALRVGGAVTLVFTKVVDKLGRHDVPRTGAGPNGDHSYLHAPAAAEQDLLGDCPDVDPEGGSATELWVGAPPGIGAEAFSHSDEPVRLRLTDNPAPAAAGEAGSSPEETAAALVAVLSAAMTPEGEKAEGQAAAADGKPAATEDGAARLPVPNPEPVREPVDAVTLGPGPDAGRDEGPETGLRTLDPSALPAEDGSAVAAGPADADMRMSLAPLEAARPDPPPTPARPPAAPRRGARLLPALCVFSLLAASVVAVGWVRSYQGGGDDHVFEHSVDREDDDGFSLLVSARGSIGWITYPPRPAGEAGYPAARYVLIPYWLLFAITLILPLAWLLRKAAVWRPRVKP